MINAGMVGWAAWVYGARYRSQAEAEGVAFRNVQHGAGQRGLSRRDFRTGSQGWSQVT